MTRHIHSKPIPRKAMPYLKENNDISSLTMDIQGFGNTQPIASNKNENKRKKNVESKLSFIQNDSVYFITLTILPPIS